MSALAEFHFLYPLWFLLIPVALLTWWWLSRQSTQSQAWQHFIDERLKPFVISGKEAGQSRWLRHGLLLASLIAITALAGPSWQKRELPAFQTQQGLVLVLDLSLSMLATDVTPNRINRARFKLLDLLKIRQEGQTGLVVFAGDAFAVSPLTDDVENIIEQAKNLSPGIMPAQGSFIYRGIDEAAMLLQQAGYATGDILIIADGVSNLSRTLQSAEASAAAGYRISVAAIGTAGGAPIPMSQNAYFRDQQGQLVMAKLDTGPLKEIASKGQGLFQELVLSDDDIERFQAFFQQDNSSVLDNKKTTVEHWHNEGIWLLWLLLLPVLLLFRKGYLFSLGICVVVLSMLTPQPASAFDWETFWLNDDQRAHRALLDKKHEEAKVLFKSKQWKASAAYRNGDFEESAGLFEEADIKNVTADSHYNKGNALAKAGKLEEAIKSYDQALALQGDHEDAKFNQDLLKKMQQEQQKKQNQQDQQNKQDDQQDQRDKQEGQEGQQNKDNKGQQQDKKNQQDPKQGDESQQGQQSEEEKKKAEAAKKQAEEEAKKRIEEAKKEAQQQAEKQADKQKGKQKPEEKEMTEEQKEQARQTKQWLHQIPDDSAGLWRRKFQYQYRQRQPAGAASGNVQGHQPW